MGEGGRPFGGMTWSVISHPLPCLDCLKPLFREAGGEMSATVRQMDKLIKTLIEEIIECVSCHEEKSN